MANFTLTTHWTSGDVLPFLRLGTCLKARGHEVNLAAPCYYAEQARRAGLNFVAWDTPEEWAQQLEDNALIGNPLANMEQVRRFRRKYQNARAFLAEYEKLLPLCRLPDTVLVGRHESSTAAFLAAELLQLPLASVFLAPSYVTSIDIDEEMFGDTLVADLNDARAALGLAPVARWRDWVCAPKLCLGFWPEWFARIEEAAPVRPIPVGFPTFEPDGEGGPGFPSRGDAGARDVPVLVCGGTGKQLHSGFYAATLEALRRLGRPALVVTPHRELLPGDLPGDVRWFARLPFADVMPRVAAVIHHGGIGTASQALAAGALQLILADYYDRPANAKRLQALGVAEHLPPAQWNASAVVAALERLLTADRQARCEGLAARMRDERFAVKACEQLEAIAGARGFAMQAPAPGTRALQRAPPPGEGRGGRGVSVTGARRQLLIRMLREERGATGRAAGRGDPDAHPEEEHQ